MPGRVLCTLHLPDPYTEIVSPHGEIVELGRIPSAGELSEVVAGGSFTVLCPQVRDSVDARILDAGLPELRAICTYSVGYNNVDVEAATARGIVVANTPGVLTDATADCTLALILDAARRITEGDRALRTGRFIGWEPEFMLGLELRDSLLGIVGFGRIGQAVARRALAFGMRVAYATRSAPALPADLEGRVEAMDFDSLVAAADVLSVHTPLTSETHHLINADVLRRMRSTAILINTARGPVVDEAALVTALGEGWIGAAGLDVYEHEPDLTPGLAQLENVVLAPHLGSATRRTRAAMAELCARNTAAVLLGQDPPHWVNRADLAG